MHRTLSSPLQTIILFGLVSLFADATYESARSIIGPYMALLGASATAISVVSGAGELIGYTMRLVSGRIADRTRLYWVLLWAGYLTNLLAVPLLALVGNWQVAAALVIVERLGKALRTPVRDALLANATAMVGHGRGFGLHEALDQIGAIAGPLLITAALASNMSYRGVFGALFIPALAAFIVLALLQGKTAKHFSPAVAADPPREQRLPSAYRRFLIGACFAAAGFVDFPLLAYHLHAEGMSNATIPFLYAVAMGVDAVAALVLGRLFDRWGIRALVLSGVISAGAAVLVVTNSSVGYVLGIMAWGIGMGAHESILRATIAMLVPAEQRGTGYGMLSAWYGVSWFLGSAALGALYPVSPLAMATTAAILQLAGAAVWLSLPPMQHQRRW